MSAVQGVEIREQADGGMRCRLDTEHAQGWIVPAAAAAFPVTPEQFWKELAAAMNRGFVAADAAVLATMATHHPDRLPLLSWGDALPELPAPRLEPRRLDLYAIVDSAQRVEQVLAAGVKTVQLRMKTPDAPDGAWDRCLRENVDRSVRACADHGAELFVNDHWELAAEAGAPGVHLGQEDLLALGQAGRFRLQASAMALGISSHSLWELCRARTLSPRYIACGPVWPTLTKAMPWRAQGLRNLAWWCRMAQVPVVAIGGILGAEQVRESARAGADGICIVRGLGERPEQVVPALQAALEDGRRRAGTDPVDTQGPHPSLAAATGAAAG